VVGLDVTIPDAVRLHVGNDAAVLIDELLSQMQRAIGAELRKVGV
jgi:hypothetical protein